LDNGCKSSNKILGGIAYLYYENNGNRQLEVDIEFTKLENFKIAKFFKTSEKTVKIIVPPGTKQVAILK